MSLATTYVRKSIWGLETPNMWDPSTTAYVKAVAEMNTRSEDDPTSWAYQAAMHGSYSDPPANAVWNQCQHGTWFFLPWHRMYLYWFERIVRSIVVQQGGPSDWALPFWNYSLGPPGDAASGRLALMVLIAALAWLEKGHPDGAAARQALGCRAGRDRADLRAGGGVRPRRAARVTGPRPGAPAVRPAGTSQ